MATTTPEQKFVNAALECLQAMAEEHTGAQDYSHDLAPYQSIAFCINMVSRPSMNTWPTCQY